MITSKEIIEVLKSYSTYTDRSRTDECVHESNFDLIAKDLVKKLTIPVVSDSNIINNRCECKDYDPVDVKLCANCDGYGYTLYENGKRKEHCKECE